MLKLFLEAVGIIIWGYQDHHFEETFDFFRRRYQESKQILDAQKKYPCDQEIIFTGMDSLFVSSLDFLCSKEDFNCLFPARYGTWMWQKITGRKSQEDYYSYDNFQTAVRFLSNIECRLILQSNGGYVIYRKEKETQQEIEVWRHPAFNDQNNKKQEILIDFGQFLTTGNRRQRLRELSAFLAHIAAETSGGGQNIPGGELAWGLTWNKELNHTHLNYIQKRNPLAKPYPNQQYFGRGPIQLTWNYNYAKTSAILFGDKELLLKEPDLISRNGVVGYATAIMFWMMPQHNKPSCHDVILGIWQPKLKDRQEGRLKANFGVTILIINGGENDCDATDSRIARRINFFQYFQKAFGIPIVPEKTDTKGMKPF